MIDITNRHKVKGTVRLIVTLNATNGIPNLN